MTITVGASTPTGNLSHYSDRHGWQHQADGHGYAHGNHAAELHDFSFTSFAQRRARQSGTSTITTAISGGFNSAITLSASGAPSGTTVSFNPNPIPAPGSGSSTMTITVGASTPIGTYPITVTGTGGSIKQTATVTLTVTTPPNFTISASPVTLSVAQGNQGTSTITTAISGGFNSAITLSASGAPSGTTVSFNPNPIPAPGSGSSTMTITVGASTPTGTYPITVTGNGGGVQQNVTVTLIVTAGVAVDAVGPGSMVTNISTMSWNHTCSGSNRLLVVGIAMGTSSSDASAVLSVTYNGTPMVSAGKRHANDQSAGFGQLFYLVAPPTGTHTVTVTETGYSGYYTLEGGSTSFTGVNQTTPGQNTVSSIGSNPNPTLSVTSASGHMVVDVVVDGSAISTSGQTLEWLNNDNGNTGGGNAAQSTAAGAPSVTMSYTAVSDWWAMIGMDVVPTGVTLVSVAVTPTNPSIAAGNQLQFTATGTFSDGSQGNLTSSATWTSSAPSVATINSTGLATGSRPVARPSRPPPAPSTAPPASR